MIRFEKSAVKKAEPCLKTAGSTLPKKIGPVLHPARYHQKQVPRWVNTSVTDS